MPFKPGQSGNPNGRPSTGTSQQELLLEALKVVEKKKGKTLLEHACEQAFDDNRMLLAVLKKMIPDLKAVEINHASDTGEPKKKTFDTIEEVEAEMKRRGIPF